MSQVDGTEGPTPTNHSANKWKQTIKEQAHNHNQGIFIHDLHILVSHNDQRMSIGTAAKNSNLVFESKFLISQ